MFDWDNMRIKKRSPEDWHASPIPEQKRDSVFGVVVKKKYSVTHSEEH